MSKKPLYNSVLFFLSLNFSIYVAAQPNNILKASVDKNRLLIGETFHLKVEAKIPAGKNFSLPHVDSIPHFEIRKRNEPKDTNINGQRNFSQEYLLASFDSGHWVIPRLRADRYITDSIPIDVVFSEFDPTKDYHDIKDIIEVESSEKKKIPWWLFVAGILFLGLFLWQVLKRKQKTILKPSAPPIDPYKEAMDGLEKLSRSNLSGVEYYSELIRVFRLYVFRKKGILSLQKTTDELVIQLKPLIKENEGFAVLSQALRLSDFVKFAKYKPAAGEDKIGFDTIKNAIISIENIAETSTHLK